MLFALAVYVMVSAAHGFFTQRPLSLLLAILVLWWLAKGKRRIADEIGSLSSPESFELVEVDGGPVFA